MSRHYREHPCLSTPLHTHSRPGYSAQAQQIASITTVPKANTRHKHPHLKRHIKNKWDRRISHRGITDSKMRLAVCVTVSLLFWQFRYCETKAEGVCVHAVVCYPDCDPCTNSNDTNKRNGVEGRGGGILSGKQQSLFSHFFLLFFFNLCTLSAVKNSAFVLRHHAKQLEHNHSNLSLLSSAFLEL